MYETTVFICPRCQNRCVRSPYTGDYQHDCFGSNVLANEDVQIIGDWSDYTNQGNETQTEQTITTKNKSAVGGTVWWINGSQITTQEFRLNTNTPRILKYVGLALGIDGIGLPNGLDSEYIFAYIRDALEGNILSTGSVRAGSVILTASQAWHTLPVNDIILDSNKTYYLDVNFPSGTSNNLLGSRVGWWVPSTSRGDVYPGGVIYLGTAGNLAAQTGSDAHFEIYTSESNITRQPQPLMAGTENKLRNTRAGLEGGKEYPKTSRGFNKNTHRTRRHIEHIDEENFKQKGIPDREPETSFRL